MPKDREEFWAKQEPSPKTGRHPLDDKPIPWVSNGDFLRAFDECDPYRSLGFGVIGPIPPAAIELWVKNNESELTPRRRAEVFKVLPVMDRAWRVYVDEEQRRRQPGQASRKEE